MKILKLTSVALALASLPAMTSCADQEESIIIAGAPAWQMGCSVTVPASTFLTNGFLDLRFGTEYIVPLEIQNQLQSQSPDATNSGTDTSEFQLTGIDVRISSSQRGDLIDRLEDENPAYVDFSPAIPTNSLSGGASLGIAVTGIPAATAARLADFRVEEALLAADAAEAELDPSATEQQVADARLRAQTGVLFSYETYEVSFALRARRTGNKVGSVGEIEARGFRFPIDVCFGCLISCGSCENPGECPAGSLPADPADRTVRANFMGLNVGCQSAQDDYFIPNACM